MVSAESLKSLETRAVTAILSGPTASGKTAIALEWARRLRARVPRGQELEIINADSLLVYRTLDIGTAKPSREELLETPHHLIDIIDPDQSFTAGDFTRAVFEVLEQIAQRGNRALIVGGSGFYLKALLYGLWEGAPTNPELRAQFESIPSAELYRELLEHDPETALRIGVNDRYRLVRAHELIRLTGQTPSALQAAHHAKTPSPDPRFRLLVIDRTDDRSRDGASSVIRARAQAMLRAGLIGETRALRERYPGSRALQAVGYRQVSSHLDGQPPQGRRIAPGEEGLLDEIELATRQLVKRQRTWFKSEKNAERFELERDREALFRRFEEIYASTPF